MRGPISDTGDVPAGAAYRVSGPVPSLYHEDPLFLELCGALGELLSPVVTALDCFSAYLDPWLAPEDFLGWLAGLVGVELDGIGPVARRRALIAGAVAGYRVKGTVAGLRACAADAAGVPIEQVRIGEGGGVTWAQTSGTAPVRPYDPVVLLTITVPAGRDRAALAGAVRDAVSACLPVWSRLRIEVVER
jgi:phage tail-like protein